MKRALLAGTAVAVLVAVAPASSAKTGTAYEPCPGPLACGADLSTALELEANGTDHLHQGFMVAMNYATAEKLPGDITGAGGYGDSGLWTGVYLGGESFRYATAKAKLADLVKHSDATKHDGLSDAERAQLEAFWTAQRDQALGRARQMVAAFHRNVNIAAAWQTTTKVPPTVDPGNSKHPVDFGGGVIKGEPGMLMRACTTVGDPLGIHDNGADDRVVGPFKWEDGKDYWCEASPSRDTYAGTTFGMLTAFDLVSTDDPAMRTMLRDDLVKMGDFLLKYGWNYPRPWGYVSPQHDFDGAISPLFVYVPMARLNLTNAVRHVVDLVGDAVTKAKWDGVWAEEFANQGPELGPSMEVDSAQPNDGYYKFNLHHLTAFNLLRTTSGAERELILNGVAVMDKTTRDDINAHFEAITYAMSGEKPRLDAAVTHLRQWVDYRNTIETGAAVNNSQYCGKSIVCVPEDQYDIATPAGDVTWFPGQPDAPPLSEKGKPRAAGPLPVAVRPPSDFIWQRPPTQLDGQAPATWREPGIDYLTPYWMLRYFTEVVPATSTPIPEWVGPAHK
ncbi:MAG: hypothetical protein QOK42_469 [Frankiaceae bacterium]|nr:hypothetical protein [Frankiaceae bacterium]